MDVLVLIARLLLAATFAIAGIGKLGDRTGSRQSLTDFGVPAFLVGPFAWLLPIAELAGAVTLVPFATAWYGAAGVLAMLMLFIVGIAVNMARGRRPDCHCFGQLHSEPVGWPTLVRNGVLLCIAALVLWQGPGASLANALTSLNGWQIATLAAAALSLFELWLLFDILRQNGRLLLRLEAVEARQTAQTAASPKGLPVDTPAPDFSLPGLDDRPVTLDMLRQEGKPVLLVFTNSDCPPCDALLPEVARWQQEHVDRLSIVPVSRGSADTNRAKMAKHSIRNALLQNDTEPSNSYRAQVTPSAVLVRDGMISSSLAVGTEDIRGLVARAMLPPPVKKGQPAPSLTVTDLDGNPADLATRRGRRTLLLFWNPACGFCQKMLPGLKTWERNHPAGAPELLVISSGPVEDNRQQGFRAPVWLDGAGTVMRAFGADGTPSAVLLDEGGTVASDIGIGAEQVMTLAVPVTESR